MRRTGTRIVAVLAGKFAFSAGVVRTTPAGGGNSISKRLTSAFQNIFNACRLSPSASTMIKQV